MRDEKVCPTCGGDLVWEGNVLDGALACPSCKQAALAVKGFAPAMQVQDEEYACMDPAKLRSTLRISDHLRKLMMEEAQRFIDDAKVKIYKGAEPAAGEEPDPSTLLADIRLNGPDWSMPIKEQEVGRVGGCGKTYDMVLRALACADGGWNFGSSNQVVILTTSHRMKKYVEKMIEDMGVKESKHSKGLYIVSAHLAGSVRVMTVQDSPRGMNRMVKVFADHSVFDPKFKDDLGEWVARYEKINR